MTLLPTNSLSGKRIHFIGIGGSGMSGLARIALADGLDVSGSDSKESTVLTALTALGARIFNSHSAANLDGVDIVIYSTAIAPTNPEMKAAVDRKLLTLPRAKALALLMQSNSSIAIAGTHGKTTTSSMATVALQSCGEDPSFAIGGTLTAAGANAHRGSGKFFIAEADESDGSFIEYHPHAAIITNIEHDHVDFFATPEAVTKAFQDFVRTIPDDGILIFCADDIGSRTLGESTEHCATFSYGTLAGSNLLIDQIELSAQGSRARILWNSTVVGELELSVPGHHNLLNAAGTVALGIALGLNPSQLLKGLKSFRGAGRRFELKASIHGVRIVDDYGHHPTEIKVTLEAARRYADTGRVLVLFQPHRYSRTQAFLADFARALESADDVTLLEIYAAGEQPIPGVSSSQIIDLMRDEKVSAHFIPNFEQATEYIVDLAIPGDVILTLGAGDVNSLAEIIGQGLVKKFG